MKENEELQSLRCVPEVGGDCDILLGIFYKNIHPTPIHALESGLTIYKLKMTPHDKRYQCVIGGPHESFSLAQYFGGFGAFFTDLTKYAVIGQLRV